MEKLGSIQLGNFCKALLEHKDIEIYNGILRLPYIFRWNGERYIDTSDSDDFDYTPTEIITLFLEDIYNLKCEWRVME